MHSTRVFTIARPLPCPSVNQGSAPSTQSLHPFHAAIASSPLQVKQKAKHIEGGVTLEREQDEEQLGLDAAQVGFPTPSPKALARFCLTL